MWAVVVTDRSNSISVPAKYASVRRRIPQTDRRPATFRGPQPAGVSEDFSLIQGKFQDFPNRSAA